jgi:hypothetical protein
MFRLKKNQQSISPEEEARLRGAIAGTPQVQVQPIQQPVQAVQMPQEVKSVSKTPTQYFISKKEFVKERKTITTDTGQIIELPEETTRAMTKEVYLLTAEDMVEILKSVDNSTNLYKVILQMLMGKM